jgi:hypothetical protein
MPPVMDGANTTEARHTLRRVAAVAGITFIVLVLVAVGFVAVGVYLIVFLILTPILG